MNKILVFLDELYVYNYNENIYSSKYTSGLFFKKFTNSEVRYILPVSSNNSNNNSYSNTINGDFVHILPEWNSNASFFKQYILSVRFRREIKKTIRKALDLNDTVWIRYPSFAGYLISRQAIKNDKQIIFHIAGGIKDAWRNPKYKGHKLLIAWFTSQLMHYFQIKSLKKSRSIVLCTGDHLVNLYSRYNSNTIFFIDSTIDITMQQKHINNNDIVNFVFIGRLTIEKGVWVLLNAYNLFVKRNPKIKSKLSIVGFGPEEDNIHKFIKENGLIEKIIMHGFVKNTDIGKVLSINDFLVLPSITHEGFPRVITEAWSYGLGIISVELDGVKSLAVNDKNIIYCLKNNIDSLVSSFEKVTTDDLLRNNIYDNVTDVQKVISYDYYKQLIESKLGFKL